MQISPSSGLMTDNGGGLYSTSYISWIKGYLTVTVYGLVPGAYVEYYSDKVFTEPYTQTDTMSNINSNWGTGNIFSTLSDNISAKIYFVIKAPYTETYTFRLLSNEGSDLNIDNARVISNLGTQWDWDDSVNINLTAGTYYNFR